MKKLSLLFVFAFFIISCRAQKTDLHLQWKEFESEEAGIKASFPCEPQKYYKSFQDEPRPIHVYDFSCEAEGMKFLISSKNYMDDFNENTFKKTFEANESNLKTLFGATESFELKKDFVTNGLSSQFYEVKLKAGGKINSLLAVSKTRSYQAMFGISSESEKKLKKLNIDFEKISKKFTDSFQIIEK